MPKLDYITIEGLRSIDSIKKLRLRPINVLVGPNGAGKSVFIGAFSFLHAIREGHLQEYVIQAGGADHLLHFGSKTTRRIHIHISFAEETNQYSVDLRPTESDELVPYKEVVSFWDKDKYPDRPYDELLTRRGKEAGITESKKRVAEYVRRHLDSWRLYHFHDTSSSSPMKKTADVDDNRFLRPDARNLAAFLFYLKSHAFESYRMIRKTIQLVAPFFDDFSLEPQRTNKKKIKLEWKHRHSDAYFDASSLSDGTLRFIALATLFLQPIDNRPSVILVDEPELGLHPFAIAMLASLVNKASRETQVIVSTQSPLLLDHFQPEDVLVVERVEEGTQLTRLDSERLRTWLGDYSLGQLWEKNELGGRPGGGGKHGPIVGSRRG